MNSHESATAIIERLGLQPHPEGGWYSETWCAETAPETRPGATAIFFLLEAHQRSHWHRVLDADEVWLWHAGSPLVLAQAPCDAGPVTQATLGANILAGETPQLVVPKGAWQAAWPVAESAPGWTLVSCVVAPGFDFSVFELAPPGWAPGA